MSVLSTLDLPKREALILIIKELGEEPYNIDNKDDNQLIADILFIITQRNPHSPYHDNNYWITDNNEQVGPKETGPDQEDYDLKG